LRGDLSSLSIEEQFPVFHDDDPAPVNLSPNTGFLEAAPTFDDDDGLPPALIPAVQFPGDDNGFSRSARARASEEIGGFRLDFL